MKLRGILFDKDGTLVDVNRTWGPAALEVMQQLAPDSPQNQAALRVAMRYADGAARFADDSPLLAGAPDDYAADWADILGLQDTRAFRDDFAARLALAGERHLSPIGEPAKILAALAARGFCIGLATNHREASSRRQLQLLCIDRYFSHVYGSDSGHGRKPDPGMILAFARETGIPAAEIALVGDSFHDLRAARAAGAKAIAVASGLIPRQRLAAEADLVLNDLSELETHLLTEPVNSR